VRVASAIGCTKFVNIGTAEESYVEIYTNHKNKTNYFSPQLDYGLAKLAARDMCKIVAYLEKIDYIHTRISAPVDIQLKAMNYISSTIKNIIRGEPYVTPTNPNLFDFIGIGEAARAYRLVGEFGRNKADYFIGTGAPTTLEFFFKTIISSLRSNSNVTLTAPMQAVPEFFSVERVRIDTGFVSAPLTNCFDWKSFN